ncbi:hypothetical protein DM01DRAFT_1349919 [Hesseltinella vesiculosa]|uniref:Uncharacterized protein n=1 Tax=Hesseltinella vesiculosa TaxID=101127 RepID=A0A1X2G3K9_9FUNG|nr:hypothetical protein DM01DRAFT_1349919 [Hesseltinella vesiculosa]
MASRFGKFLFCTPVDLARKPGCRDDPTFGKSYFICIVVAALVLKGGNLVLSQFASVIRDSLPETVENDLCHPSFWVLRARLDLADKKVSGVGSLCRKGSFLLRMVAWQNIGLGWVQFEDDCLEGGGYAFSITTSVYWQPRAYC